MNANRPVKQFSLDNSHFTPAILKGYKRYRVFGCDYPAILKTDENQETRGILVKGLTSSEIQLLDKYEGEQYVRTDVEVYIENTPSNLLYQHNRSALSTSLPSLNASSSLKLYTKEEYDVISKSPKSLLVPAQTYVWIDSPALLDDVEWDPEEFKREKLEKWSTDDYEEYAL
ncbi:4425_t:CDS:2 [Ambispora leptoticha]|uniref:Putative gamma-glutamylcyclotransferase n=1 Tax=Ambispora leptoticha TaxID=144679 RepID=A0A9N8VKT1_9GLOM|nr:4425_t:CDS:2 [Ambispora leptoticha]